ncbi:MAG: class I SAM-dependent methyltransferase [Acidimicrobiales bacterium]
MNAELLAVLWCPADHGTLRDEGEAARCEVCERRYPIIDGVLSFLFDADLSEQDRAEQADRDQEADWYDSIWPEYIDRVELPAHTAWSVRPAGPVLDLGCGPGRITEHLARVLGHPTIGLDYSLTSLKLLARRCEGLPVLAVHADGRSLPIRDGALQAATAGQSYSFIRPEGRHQMLQECARILQPGGELLVSTLNFNLTFWLWKLKGNQGAKEGEHMYGSNFYYVRQTPAEFRGELERVFRSVQIRGIRNIPVRTIATAFGRVGGPRRTEQFMAFMARRGVPVDRVLERVPIFKRVGFLLLARVSRPLPLTPPRPRADQSATVSS